MKYALSLATHFAHRNIGTARLRRDPKGLYKKAEAGELQNLTGLQAPYEEPQNPELIVDTENHTVEESVNLIISALKKLGY